MGEGNRLIEEVKLLEAGDDQIQYFGRTTTSVAGTGAGVNLNFISAGGADLVDLTDPTQPAVNDEGEYLLRFAFKCAKQVGKLWGVEIDLDLSGNDWFGIAGGKLDDVNPMDTDNVYGSFEWQGPVPADGVLQIAFAHDTGAPVDVFWRAWLTKQSSTNVALT